MGAQYFQLATDHKPLLPLFNNPNVKLPPRTERMVMNMQNLDFNAIHIPGKSNMTDYLSRHPLTEVEKSGHERHIRAVIETDHAVGMETIQSATKDDKASFLSYFILVGTVDSVATLSTRTLLCVTYSTERYQRFTHKSWFTNLEQTTLNRCQPLPTPYKRLLYR